MNEFKVSKCCGKHGWVLKYDRRASGTNYYDAEKEGICPKCEQPARFISQDDFNKLKTIQNEFTNQIS